MAIKNIVVTSDQHIGCQLGLCPPEVTLDGQGIYQHSKLQKIVWKKWLYFWNEFVPHVTKGEDFIWVNNGDAIDGIHHNAVSQITHNITDQVKIAEQVFSTIVNNPKCKGVYFLRGTSAHVGESGQNEEMLAKNIGAVPEFPDNEFNPIYARNELFLRFGDNKTLVHFTHHIGATGSMAYESTAPHKEMIEMYTEAGRWGVEPPAVLLRSHRHRFYLNTIASKNMNSLVVITPGWQMKTSFVYKGLGGRTSQPQIGGVVLREGDEVPVYVRHKIWDLDRPREVVV